MHACLNRRQVHGWRCPRLPGQAFGHFLVTLDDEIIHDELVHVPLADASFLEGVKLRWERAGSDAKRRGGGVGAVRVMAVVLLRLLRGRARAAVVAIVVAAAAAAAAAAATAAASAPKGVDEMAAKAVNVTAEPPGGKETLDFIPARGVPRGRPVLLPLHLLCVLVVPVVCGVVCAVCA